MKQKLVLASASATLGALVGVYVAYVNALGAIGAISEADRLQIVLAFGNLLVIAILAGVTLWYAKSTNDIANATQTQAEATRDQARVVARQLAQGVRPIIRFGFDSLAALDRFNFVIRNIGIGPALNVRCWVQYQQPGGSSAFVNNDGHQRQFRTSVLEVNSVMGDGTAVNWLVNIVPAPTDNPPSTFFAVYQDVYGNNFASKAVYRPVDFQGTRPLMVSEFSVSELTVEEAKSLLTAGGYNDSIG